MTLSILSQAKASHLGCQRPLPPERRSTSSVSFLALPKPPAESESLTSAREKLDKGSVPRARLNEGSDREDPSSVLDLKDYRIPTQGLDKQVFRTKDRKLL